MSNPPPLLEHTLEAFFNCWRCRFVACGGLIASGLFVFGAARRRNLGRPFNLFTAVQMASATGLITSGLLVIDERVGMKDTGK
uniref:uncharacterized protein LOC558782 n=1 Tax=Danio rerio TaxID=7955 RepID=UPI003D9E68D6